MKSLNEIIFVQGPTCATLKDSKSSLLGRAFKMNEQKRRLRRQFEKTKKEKLFL
jgi:hypothetical protein